MRKISRNPIFTMLALGAAFAIQTSRGASKSDDHALPMRFAGSMPVVEVMVNGKGPFLFGIDTGGQGKARVDSSLTEKLGLRSTGQVAGSDSSGRNPQQHDYVRVGSVEIGGLRFADVEAMSRNYKAMPRMSQIDGILTLNFFSGYLLTLDYPAKMVRLSKGELPKADGAEIIEYKSEGGIPVVSLRFGEAEFSAHLDSGNMIGGFVVPAAMAAKLSFTGEPVTVGRARSMSGEVEIKEGRAKDTARLGRYEFRDPVVTFPAVSDFINIGSKVLNDFALTFDQRNTRLQLVRKGADRKG